MTAARSCPGDLLAGLVDGQLDHQDRERVQRHLVDCADCRAERTAQAELKTVLRRAAAPPVSEQLTARLLDLAAPTARPVPSTGGRLAGAHPTGLPTTNPYPTNPHPTAGRRAGQGPVRLRPTGRREFSGRHRLALGSCLVALSFGAAFALGAPRAQAPVVRLDPGTDVFVADYAGVTTDLPARPAVTSNRPSGR